MASTSDSLKALVSGGVAGFAVDICLFPLDTIKTRAQAREGFRKAGGFNGLFKGLGPAALGSFPGAAAFFLTYETAKARIASTTTTTTSPAQHLLAASLGEMVACLVRVPTENIKQNLQANRHSTAAGALRSMKSWGSLYNGYASTLLREIPFSALQFPLWELGKRAVGSRYGGREGECPPLASAALGSLSGGFAAACTTPLDVVKTRLMTSPDEYTGVVHTFRRIVREEGRAALFRGIEPRVMWISIGGFVFFGAYEEMRSILSWLD